MVDDFEAPADCSCAHELDTSAKLWCCPGRPGSALSTQVPAVLFWQHWPKINRCRDEKVWRSIAGCDQTFYKSTVPQVSVAGICELRV
jgi:hypothetical protein